MATETTNLLMACESKSRSAIETPSITGLLHRHTGETAWIFGKGPSLDSFDLRSAGALRICINESLLRVPKVSYFFAHDETPIFNVAAHWPSGCLAILQPARAVHAIATGVDPGAIHTYEKLDGDRDSLAWTADEIAMHAALIGLSGTVHSALHFCKLIGATSIVFVAMDGGPDYAKSLALDSPLGGGRHDLIRRDSEWIADRLGLPYSYASSTAVPNQ